MKFLSFFSNKKSYSQLSTELEVLKSEIRNIEEKHILELKNKDLEINHLKEKLSQNLNLTTHISKISSNSSSDSLELPPLSRLERQVLELHVKFQCKDYTELSKVTNKTSVNLRNIVMRIKKKGYNFTWHSY